MQFSSKYPDFKHRTSKAALWIDKRCNPEWVKSKLAALKSFNSSHPKQHESYNSVASEQIYDLCKHGDISKALDILDRINGQEVKVDCYASLLQGCIKIKSLAKGQRLHAHIIQNRLEQLEFISSTLVKLYTSCGSLLNAQDVFDEMPSTNSFSFNTLIAAYVESGFNDEALRLFHKMKRAEVKPDKYTFMSVFKACANLKSLEEGKKAHVYMADCGINADAFLDAAIVNMYAKCGNLESARCALDVTQQPNIVSCTALIAGYAQSGNYRDALELFDQMQSKGVKPDVASCNAIISGFADNGHSDEAVKFFQKMQKIGRVPDMVTLASILKACANLKDLEGGKQVHAYILEHGINLDAFLEVALVRMWKLRKCMQCF